MAHPFSRIIMPIHDLGLRSRDGHRMSASDKKNAVEIIESFEKVAFSVDRGPPSAAIEVIDDLAEYCKGGGLRERGNPSYVCEHWYTRLASALTHIFTAPGITLTEKLLDDICRRKSSLTYIFAASGYRNMKHLTARLTEKQGSRLNIDRERGAILLALLGLDDLNGELIDLALAQSPRILLKLMLGWLNQRAVLSPVGEENRTKLLQAGALISDVEITDADIGAVVQAWMYCSYADTPTKHDIKRHLNKLLTNRMLSAGICPAPVTHTKKKRPKLMVIHERFNTRHAMYRCWAPSIRALRDHFDLIALSEDEYIDPESEELFDKVIQFTSAGTPVSMLAEMVQAETPDMIYYPSIGMSHWTIMLAQLRLAPIQVMTHGHPATSMLPTIDYAYVFEMQGDLAAIHSEKILVGNKQIYFEAHTDLPEELPPLSTATDREVRVAVNSKVMKLSHRLITICQKLVREADVPVRFSFFPGERFLFNDGLWPAIQSYLPTADVFPTLKYEPFIRELAKCDIALAAFPFGNTNSTVDTCLLTLPTVAHFGPEGPAQTDRLILESIGAPDWLVCQSDDEYFSTALQLINQPDLRQSVRDQLASLNIREQFFANERDVQSNPFAPLMWYVYENHAALQASEARVFHYKDLLG